jgi:hypothetical protein
VSVLELPDDKWEIWEYPDKENIMKSPDYIKKIITNGGGSGSVSNGGGSGGIVADGITKLDKLPLR